MIGSILFVSGSGNIRVRTKIWGLEHLKCPSINR